MAARTRARPSAAFVSADLTHQTEQGVLVRRPEIRRVHSGVDARDVQKNTRLQLLLVEAVLHEITDTHDALDLVVLDDRQVTDPRYRHCRKHGIHAIGRATGAHGRRHQLVHLKPAAIRRRDYNVFDEQTKDVAV